MGFSARCIETPRWRSQVGIWAEDRNWAGGHTIQMVLIKPGGRGDVSGVVSVDRKKEVPGCCPRASGVEGDLMAHSGGRKS